MCWSSSSTISRSPPSAGNRCSPPLSDSSRPAGAGSRRPRDVERHRAVNPTRDRAAIRAALDTVVGEFNDPRNIDRGSPVGRSSASPDQPLGISQSLDIERGDVGALEDAIARECFNGSRTAVDSQTLDGLIAGNQCASAVQNQARTTAAQMKMTTARQVQAYQSVIKAMGAAGGLRHLLLLTDGLGISQETSAVVPVARAAAGPACR